jgi:hypothetical protein
MLMRLFKLPLFLLLTLVSAVSMYVPASYALNQRDHHIARSFFYSGTLTLILALMIMVAISNRTIRQLEWRRAQRARPGLVASALPTQPKAL